MKNLRKTAGMILLAIVVLVVVIVLAIGLFGNIALKAGIETAASKALSVGVSIDDVDFSLLAGSIGFQNLVVDNPPGYEYDKLLEVGDARIAVSIGSLLTDTVNIKEIMLDGVNLVIEQKGVTGNNLQDIIKAIPKGQAEPEEPAEKPAKKLHVDTLEITNVTVKAKLLPVPGKVDTVTLKLDPIRMTDLGSDDKLDAAKLSSRILLAIAAGIAEQGAGLLPKGMTDGMETALSGATQLGKTAVEESKKLLEKTLEEGKDTGEELIEGFKGLLKPKK